MDFLEKLDLRFESLKNHVRKDLTVRYFQNLVREFKSLIVEEKEKSFLSFFEEQVLFL